MHIFFFIFIFSVLAQQSYGVISVGSEDNISLPCSEKNFHHKSLQNQERDPYLSDPKKERSKQPFANLYYEYPSAHSPVFVVEDNQ